MAAHPTPLKFLGPAWFSIVMGGCGLSLAWLRAVPLMGEAAQGIALALGAASALVFVLLLAASVMRLRQHPQAWQEDAAHPVRYAFVAAGPAAVILLATVGTSALGAPLDSLPTLRSALVGLWWLGCLAQLAVTLWVVTRWWRGATSPKTGGLQWAGVTPVLLIPIVGNVLAPLAGVPLGQVEWAAAQFGVGLMFWPVVMALLLVRIALQGLWPERLLPAAFILIAPPAVVGLSALQLGAPLLLGWALWGMALFSLLWAGALMPRILAQPFGLAHWGMSFPLAAFTALTLRLAQPGGLLAVLGPMLLAITSLVILGLGLATVRGLRQGTMLAPEQVAVIQPVQAAAG